MSGQVGTTTRRTSCRREDASTRPTNARHHPASSTFHVRSVQFRSLPAVRGGDSTATGKADLAGLFTPNPKK